MKVFTRNLFFFISIIALSGSSFLSYAQAPELVLDINPGANSSNPLQMTVIGDNVYFVSDNGVLGVEPWVSDGTESGTTLLENIHPTNGPAFNRNFVGVGSDVYLLGEEGTHGREIWKSSGSGATLLADIYPGTQSSMFEGIICACLTDLDGTLIMNARNGSGAPGTNGTELFKSDGTESGTELVKDINAGPNSSLVDGLTYYEGRLYFSANDGSAGHELWTTDGTTSGTFRVKDIRTGSQASSPKGFTVAGDFLYFTADNGTNGRELWRTDGTDGGTQLVMDINSGSAESGIVEMVAVGNTLYFNASNGSDGDELWKTTGPGSTAMLDINPGSGSSSPRNLTATSKAVFFQADDGTHGTELWVSDGTESGTQMPLDIVTGSEGSFPSHITAYSDNVYFAAEGTDGELWYSEGTEWGTYSVVDSLVHGISDISDVVVVNDMVLFNGNGYNFDGGDLGYELFRLDAMLPTSVSEITTGSETIRIYPNPGSGLLYINSLNSNDLINANFQVYDTAGRIVVEGSLDTNKIDISHLNGGYYMIRIQGEDVLYMEKVLLVK